ncbi:uncharacterized protein LOC127443927 [Myxocyprinus asiaticus]|uniref:uncharacterized protein LOC127443927 n=1 Tax=Myxocyprinus asiaticus TaxID=70543 RepID=UPI00222298A0|nr:uncharacterized protein LOC127443927 [Myxocyprinus asiaticus]
MCLSLCIVAKMCCTSLHLLIGVLLVLTDAVDNETMTMKTGMEPTTAPVPMPQDNITKYNDTSEDFKGNFTSSITPNSTVPLQNTTLQITTSAEVSGSPTPPPPSEHPQTSNDTKVKVQPTISASKTAKTITANKTSATTTKASAPIKSYGSVYIIITIILVLCIVGVIVYCCLHKNTRRYSVDLHSKQEDAQIPLSTVDGEVFDSTSVKDMKTFSAVESSMLLKDSEPVKEDKKPGGDNETADVKKEHNENSQVKENPKAEELIVVDLTDGELAISTKTSFESLDEPLNENNSNNTRAEVNDYAHEFTEICLDGLLRKKSAPSQHSTMISEPD